MKIVDSLSAPVYVKLDASFEWPSEERMFHLVTQDGNFLCRNHPFFKSSIKTDKPVAIAAHTGFLEPNYPFIAAELMGQVVGWFDAIEEKHSSEAIVLLCWSALEKRLKVVCPEQEANGCHVDYTLPVLPDGWTVIGDIHSHVNMNAFSSMTDQTDETHRPGLHIVVGKVSQEPPQFFVNGVVDGESFAIQDHDSIFDYQGRTTFPAEWMVKLKRKPVPKVKSYRPWKGKKHKHDDYKYEPTTYAPYQSIVDKKDLPSDVTRFLDLPGGKVLKWPTDGEKELIKLFTAETERLLAAGNALIEAGWPDKSGEKVEIMAALRALKK